METAPCSTTTKINPHLADYQRLCFLTVLPRLLFLGDKRAGRMKADHRSCYNGLRWPSGEIGRRSRLKICRGSRPVSVQVRPRPPA